MGNGNGHCETHEDMQEAIATANSNQQWFQRIGRWIVGLLGTILVLVVPSLITFFIYIASIDRRVALLEQKIQLHMEKEKK